MAELGPCFTAPALDAEACRHAVEHRFAWHARDDTVPSGKVLIIVCMACDTVLEERAAPVPRTERKPKKGRGK